MLASGSENVIRSFNERSVEPALETASLPVAEADTESVFARAALHAVPGYPRLFCAMTRDVRQ